MRGLNGSRWGDDDRRTVTHHVAPSAGMGPAPATTCGVRRPVHDATDQWAHVTCKRCLRCQATRLRLRPDAFALATKGLP